MGQCLAGEPVSCDDGQSCTIDTCDSETGCKHEPSGVAIDDTERAIPDRQSDCGPPDKFAVSTVQLHGVENVVWVEAEVGLEHPWAGDLTIQLEHNGVAVKLFDRFPGDGSLSSDFYGYYVFAATGQAFAQLGGNVAIPEDTYASLDSLDAFAGMAAEGEWKLSVSDYCHDDKGTLVGWTLRVGGTCVGEDTMCSGACRQGVCECLPTP